MKYSIFILVVFGNFIFTSCEKEEEILLQTNNSSEYDESELCIEDKIVGVTSLNYPLTANIYDTVLINMTCLLANSCGGINQIISSGDEWNKQIEVEARYTGCICQYVPLLSSTSYEFIPQNSGNYFFTINMSGDIDSTIIISVY